MNSDTARCSVILVYLPSQKTVVDIPEKWRRCFEPDLISMAGRTTSRETRKDTCREGYCEGSGSGSMRKREGERLIFAKKIRTTLGIAIEILDDILWRLDYLFP